MRALPLHLAPLVGILSACGPGPDRPAPVDDAESVTFTNVSVIDVAEGLVIPDRAVVVRDGRIAAIGPTAASPGGAVIDAKGQYLMPGLWDMHVHASVDEHERLVRMPLYVANGVLGVRVMHGDEAQLAQADEVAAGSLLGPRRVVASPLLEGRSGMWEPYSITLVSAEAARAAVDSLHDLGYDFIKVLSSLPRETFLAVADEARRRGVPLVGHAPIAVSVDEATDAGLASMEHLAGLTLGCSAEESAIRQELVRAIRAAEPGYPAHMRIYDRSEFAPLASIDQAKCRGLITRLAQRGTWNVPTLTVNHVFVDVTRPTIQQDTRLQYVTDAERVAWEAAAEEVAATGVGSLPEELWDWYLVLVRRLHETGVRLLAGTDVQNPYIYAGFSLHDELAHLVEAGLTPAEALRTATLHPAMFLEATDSLGMIEVGMRADLVLLDGNPLEDIRNTTRIRGVLLQNRYLDRAALDSLLTEVREANRRLDEAWQADRS